MKEATGKKRRSIKDPLGHLRLPHLECRLMPYRPTSRHQTQFHQAHNYHLGSSQRHFALRDLAKVLNNTDRQLRR